MAGDTDTTPGWYQQEVKSINPDAQHLLETYSGLPPAEVLPHVLALRDEAFEVCKYPCIGQMRFLSFHLSHHPASKRVLEHLRADQTAGFLDAGCCFGQEIRFLANQGIPHHQLFGLDLEQQFIDLGYQLFRDKHSLGATFVVGDLTISDSESLTQALGGNIDVVFAGSLFHLWDYETQLKVAIRLLSFCRDGPGTILVSRQVGSIFAGEYARADYKSAGMHYRHNVESMKGLWYDVGEATNTRWTVEAELREDQVTQQNKGKSWSDDNIRMIWWCATRVS